MSAVRKLTKREKKGIAFRDRRQGKKGQKSAELESPNKDVPILEYQVLAESGISLPQREEDDEPSTAFFGDDGAGNTRGGPARVVGSKKRKGETGEKAQGTGEQPQRKRRKGPDGGSIVDVEQVVDVEQSEEKESGESKQRFILFLALESYAAFPGNLKYTTTAETIRAHFIACVQDPPPTVRLLTPKPSKSKLTTKLTTKTKGCAFLEFQNKHALQRALKLHHSELEGRKINVELTAGGGGKGETRLRKLKDRNKELEGQRRKKQGGPTRTDVTVSSRAEGAQRFSTTSGVEQAQVKKRTWSVGDVVETEKHRGVKKLAKDNRRRKAKSLGTGVNAIPVG